jgi:hypothetical protein
MLCFRLFSENNPAVPLADAVAQLREGQAPKDLYAVEPASFQQIPNAPFAYWVSERVRRLFRNLPSLASSGTDLKQGLATSDDFRFVRGSWELIASEVNGQEYFPYARGGGRSIFYTDIDVYVNWNKNGIELKYVGDSTGFRPSSRCQNIDSYFRIGIIWPRRPSKVASFKLIPRNSIFSVNGPAAFCDSNRIIPLMAFMNSKAFNFLVRMLFSRGSHGGEHSMTYEVGYVGAVPLPVSFEQLPSQLESHAQGGWSQKRSTDTATLTSHAFHAPALAPGRKPQPAR